jgi:hypothetical protein
MTAETATGTRVELRLPRTEMACGAVFGLAWASSMRAMMAEFAASDGGSRFSIATFIFLLPPGALLGAVVAWVLSSDRPGVRPAPRRLVWCPMIMCADPAAVPFMLATIGVGWVAGGRGTRKSRLWIGIPSVLFWIALLILTLVTSPSILSSLRYAWVGVLLFSLLGSLMIVETMVVRRLAPVGTAIKVGLGTGHGRSAARLAADADREMQ